MKKYVSAFRHSRIKKDNSYQIKIKLRIPELSFQRDLPIVYKENDVAKKLSLTINQWSNLSRNHKKLINYSKFRYEETIDYLNENGIEITTENIKKYYGHSLFDFTKLKVASNLKDLITIYYDPEFVDDYYTDDDIIEISKSIEPPVDNDILFEDDIADLFVEAESKWKLQNEIEKTKAITDPYERTDAQYRILGYFNTNKVLDVFGYYWTLQKPNGGRYINKYDRKIILRIAEYIFIGGGSNDMNDFNEEWVKKYFIYLRDFGYTDTRLFQNYTPLEINDYENEVKGKRSQRKHYTESSYKDQIKKFKRYYKKLKNKTDFFNDIEVFDIDEFNFNSLKLNDSKYSERYTQKDHYVNVEELKTLARFSSDARELEETRDLFFIQIFTSGNRSIEKDRVKFKTINGIEYVEVIHSKTNTKNISGLAMPLKELLKRYNNTFPTIKMKASEYNSNLKKIAEELGLSRDVEFIENKVNSKISQINYKKLHTCISQYFARHTLVNYLVDGGQSDEDIIKITGHIAPEILKHYKRKMTVEDKQEILDSADKINWD